MKPATRMIPRTIQLHGVEEVKDPDGVATAIVVELDSPLVVVVGGAVVVGAPVVGVVVGGAVVVGAPVVGVVVGGALVVGAALVGVVVDGSTTEGLLVGVEGEPVVLGLLADGFVDPEPPHALRVSATVPKRRRTSTERCSDEHDVRGMCDAGPESSMSAPSISSGNLIPSVSRSRRAHDRQRRTTGRPSRVPCAMSQ